MNIAVLANDKSLVKFGPEVSLGQGRVFATISSKTNNRVFRLEPDIAILYRFVLQNEQTKYYPTPSGNRTRAPWLQFQHAPFWATEACST